MKGGVGWKAAAAARLDGIPIETLTKKEPPSTVVVNEQEGDSEVSIAELDAEIEALHAKLRSEKEAIEEARSLRGRRANGLDDVDEAILHAKRDRTKECSDDQHFFLTSILGDKGFDEPVKAITSRKSAAERYPNFQNEKRLAALEKASDRHAKEIAQLKAPGGPVKSRNSSKLVNPFDAGRGFPTSSRRVRRTASGTD
jgi:hypothetical protein